MSTDKLLTYRGDVKAAVGVGGTVVLVTVHPEGQPTAVYRLGAANLSLASDALPCGGTCLVADAYTVRVGVTDSRVYQLPARGGAPAALAGPFIAPPAALALLSNNRLGVLAGSELLVVSRKDGKVLQSLPLPDA